MSRRAFTLMEMLVVLTIGSVMLGISVGMLHLLLRSEHIGRDRVYRAVVSTRLAEQFRSDTAEALRQVPIEAPALCQLILPGDRTVTYRALTEEVRREEHIADKPMRLESYTLPDGCSVAIDSDADPTLLSLVVTQNNPQSLVGREMRITALLGKDHRFTQRPTEDQ